MPSARRLRAYALVIVFVFLGILYLTGSSTSDKTFYDRTVAALKVKHEDESQHKMGTAAVMDAKLHEAAQQVKHEVVEAAEERRQREKTLGSDSTLANPDLKEADDTAQKVLGGLDETREKLPHEVGATKGKWTDDDELDEQTRPEKSEEEKQVDAELTSILKRSPIIIFSKTFCPYSKKAKSIFSKYSITPSPFIVELDEHSLGIQLQDKLLETTGRRTVPNVLINGKSIGGGDDIEKLHVEKRLIDKIKSMGGKRIMEAKLGD